VSYRRYYYITKDSTLSQLKTSIENLENLFSSEAEHAVSTDLIEVEGMNTISCPAHFVQLIHSIKLLKDLERRVESDEFVSLQGKE
jgi:hypothetical protein